MTISKPAMLPRSFALRVILALVVIQIAGAATGLLFMAQPKPLLDSNIFDRLIAWDGNWYLGIAQGGYRWNRSLAASPSHNIAFFPLWPIVDRICIALFGSFFKAAIVLASWICGLVSIFLFHQLARRIVPEAATTATALYSFWPASAFYLMGYPTGIINICTILALSSYVCNRPWIAASCIGLGTAAAPTMLFVGCPIGLHYLLTQCRTTPFHIALRNGFGWMLLALSGILLFVLYQQLAFRDPLAFIKVQAAWGYSPPPLEKLARLASFSWDSFEFHAGLQNLSAGIAEHASGNLPDGGKDIQAGIQNLVNFVFFVLCLAGLGAGSLLIKRHRPVVMCSAVAVVLGYVWFIMLTNANMLSTPRLIFPAIAMFLGLGALAGRLPAFLKVTLIAFFALFSFLEVAFVVAGYWVV